MKKSVLILLLFCSQFTLSHASTIGFDAEDSAIASGDIFTVDIVGSGFPITQGGGVDLFYNAAIVNVLSVTFDVAVWGIGSSVGAIDNSAGRVTDIVVGAFDGPQGTFVIASLELEATGVGLTSLSLTDSSINPWASFGARLTTAYVPGSVSVAPPVPLPAAFWLFGSALLGFVGLVRSRLHFR
ncbi:MAG: hypothetical protein DRR42_20225 [Gammaproteobacteria bacterium]|nr:MAG: hypothetical protein DRR42_20225 [Gammaproteobacteria bacterium]